MISQPPYCGSNYEAHKKKINAEFHIDNSQITAVTTDNGSNFVKAFCEYGVRKNGIDFNGVDYEFMAEENNEEEDELMEASSPKSSLETLNNSPDGTTPLLPAIPAHIRYTAHTLNLIASFDVMKHISSSEALSDLHENVMQKCSYFWKIAGKPKSAEALNDDMNCTLSGPGVTRWNSLYDAFQKIIANEDHLQELYERLQVKKSKILTEENISYIKEHWKCTKPIAEALDNMQGEKNAHFGILLPNIISMRRKIKKLNVTMLLHV